MGDILHALPAVTALREAHPGWTIDWAVEPRWRALSSAESASEASSPGKPYPTRPLVDHLHFARHARLAQAALQRRDTEGCAYPAPRTKILRL